MDVIVNEDQRMLQDSTRRYLEARAPVDSLRKQIDRGETFSRNQWREGAEQGWVALLIPEVYGGFAESGQGVIDAAILAEEMGRVVYPGPFLSSCVTAVACAREGSDVQQSELLPALASGDVAAAWCFAAPGPAGGTEAGGVRVCKNGDQYRLSGVATHVQDAPSADFFLVSAVAENGLSQFIVRRDLPGISVSLRDAVDIARQFAQVTFDDVILTADTLLGEYGGAERAFEHQLQLALVLQSAETVGLTDRVLEFTLDYVQQRFAFGRPVGSFQAIKHRLADHATQLEGAKALVARAAIAVQQQAEDAAIAASMANSHCGHFGTEIIRDCLHMHGGIGMTWEHDIHFYLRRAVSNEALLGTPGVHHERLCRLAGL